MKKKVYAALDTVWGAAVNAGETASNAAYLAGKKSEEALSLAKLNVRIRACRREVEGLFRELGEMLYATHASGVPADYDAQLEKLHAIDHLKAEIADLEVKAGRATTVHTCPTCGAEVGEEDAYCGECGGKL